MPGLQFSIHPRVHYPSAVSRTRNTCKPRSTAKLQRTIAAIEKHLERHPRDGLSSARVAKLRGALHG